MQDSQQQCALCDGSSTVWASFVAADGKVASASVCAAHANACGWLNAKGWALLEGWNIAPAKPEPMGGGDELLQSALTAMVDSVASITGGHFKSVAVQLHKIGSDGELLPQPLPPARGGCPHCGFTIADWKEHGRLGCPECYRTFAASIRRQIPQLHGGAEAHWGKIPQSAGSVPVQSVYTNARRHRVIRLRERLTRAVGVEDYEQASLLRDQIRELEEQPS